MVMPDGVSVVADKVVKAVNSAADTITIYTVDGTTEVDAVGQTALTFVRNQVDKWISVTGDFALQPVSLPTNIVQWSLDNATWQAMPAPASETIYLRITSTPAPETFQWFRLDGCRICEHSSSVERSACHGNRHNP